MAKKVFSTKNLDMNDVLAALDNRNMVRLRPPVRPGQKQAWDALTGALLMRRCDLIVLIVDENGKRYERVRASATPAKMTQQLKLAAVEYVLRPSAATPKWAEE